MTTKDRIAYRVKRKPGEGPRACDLLPLCRRPPCIGLRLSWLTAGSFEAEVAGAQLVHQLENPPTAACHAGERVIRYDDREAGFLGEELVDVAKERATAGEDDATLGDIGSKLRGSLLQRLFNGADDALQGLLQGLENLIAVESEAARNAFRKVAAFHGKLTHLLAGICRADLDLDALGGGLTNEDAVIPAHVVHDGLVEAVAADAGGVRINDAIQRQDRDFRRTAADVEYHRAAGFVNR